MSKAQIPALNQLRAFEVAGRLQSIKLAADELHITRTAVSRQIQKLERRLGRALFDRHHRRIELNDSGQILLASVTTAFAEIQRAIVQLAGIQARERLVISVDPDFAGLWLVPRLAELHAIMPDTLVEILAERDLNSRNSRIDCAIHFAGAGHEVEGGEILFRSRLFPVCAASTAQKSPLRSPADLCHHTLLHDRSIVEWQEYFRSYSVTTDVAVSAGIVFSETALCLESAARGQGVAIGDDFLAATHLAEGRLIKPLDSTLLSKNAYYFVVADKSAMHPAVKAFREWLMQSINSLRE